MKNLMKNPLFQFGIAGSVLPLIFLALTITMYMYSFEFINALNSDAYYNYATDDKYSYDVYFDWTKDAEAKKSFYESLKKDLPYQPARKQDFYMILLKNEEAFKEKISNNEEFYAYREYLKNHHLTVDSLVTYMKKFIDLDKVIINACFYIASLIYLLTLYFLFRLRTLIYFSSGIFYFLGVINRITSGLVFNAFSPFFVDRLGVFKTSQDYLDFTKGLFPAFIEAALTYIIIEVVILQVFETRKRSVALVFWTSFHALENTLKVLNEIKTKNPNLVITKLNDVDLNGILKYCKQNKEDFHLNLAKEEAEKIKDIRLDVSELYEKLSIIFRILKKSKFLKENFTK
ncbi:hypothetical protein [Paenibacillus periandrae]|uniref:hypothetical protein n=1 Tax=Paenibacillus periandrae TaxID=1761741 RepID=UPI001F093901|nr:hypothetical protein [Paenibacillus periandrae]